MYYGSDYGVSDSDKAHLFNHISSQYLQKILRLPQPHPLLSTLTLWIAYLYPHMKYMKQ